MVDEFARGRWRCSRLTLLIQIRNNARSNQSAACWLHYLRESVNSIGCGDGMVISRRFSVEIIPGVLLGLLCLVLLCGVAESDLAGMPSGTTSQNALIEY